MAGILNVGTISDGTNNSTPELLAKGTAKAWVNFNGVGAVSIRAGYQVSSIVDNGVGDYTVNFTNPFADVNYALIGTSRGTDSTEFSTETVSISYNTAPTVSAVRLTNAFNGNQTPQDTLQMNIVVFHL